MIPVQEPAPGIRLITLPLPFELEHVHVALVQRDDGYLLIDTGMAGAFDALSEALAQLGVEWREIRAVLATHIHPDHIGAAPQVLAASGAELLIHRAEFQYLNSLLDGDTPWVDRAFTDGGVPPECWGAIRTSLQGMRASLPVLQPGRLLEGGEVLGTAFGPATVVATPGHSSGHVCLYWPDRRLLYSGDHLIQTITPNIAWMPGRDMLGEYLASLTRIELLDVDLVIASHGEPFHAHRAWIAATRRHHAERCDRILSLLAEQPRTAYELIPALWDRDFTPFHLYFALFEVLAHLEYLRRQGRLQ